MPYWTQGEESELIDLVQQGKSMEELCEIFKRSPEALRLKLRRLGLALPRGTKVTIGSTTTLPAIEPAKDLISMAETLKLLLGALELLQKPGLSTLELKRCRAVVSTARSYIGMLKTYERMAELEQWLINTQFKLLQLTEKELLEAKDPEKKAMLGHQISEMKRSLEEAEKHGYKPFVKKPSLMAPSNVPG